MYRIALVFSSGREITVERLPERSRAERDARLRRVMHPRASAVELWAPNGRRLMSLKRR